MNNVKNGSINENKDFAKKEIDEIINKIILKNRNKLEDTYEKGNSENFSKVPTQKDKLYYLKQKKKKDEKDDLFSGEIINDARKRLGKDPIKEPPNSESNNEEKKKKKIHIKFGKKTKIDNNKKEELDEKIEEVKSQKDYNQLVGEIEKKLDNIDLSEKTKNRQKDTIDNDEIREKKPISLEKKEIKKKESTDLERKFEKEPKLKSIFSKSKTEKNKDKTKNKDIKNNKTSLDFTTKDQLNENLKKRTKETQINAPNKSIKDNKEKEPIDDELIPPAPSANKFKFKVDNFPKGEEHEKKLIEDKIENFKTKESKKDELNPEKRALDLANKHIEKQEKKVDGSSIKKSNSEALNVYRDSAHEHVFFDEDVSYSDWSPHVAEKNKKQLGNLSSAPGGEVDIEDFGEIKNVELPRDALNLDSVKLSDLGFSEKEWQELDFYSLHEPFAYVEILRERETLEKRYFLVEAEITEEEKSILDFIHETIYTMNIETESLEKMDEKEYLAAQVDEVVNDYDLDIDESSFEKIVYYLSKKSLGFDKIDPLLNDPNIEDISCDGAKVPLFLYHRKYGSLKSNIQFDSEDELSSFIFKLAQKCGKHISIAEPMLDATMPDGSRIQMTLSDEITAHGSTFTIRKFRSDPFSPPDLVEFNTMSSEMIAYMWLAIENGVNMLFAGGTASGKTSTLNALSLFIPPESKIVSIEETREINLPHPNWIPGVARAGFGGNTNSTVGSIDMYDLMKAALRQRPEYILVGEIRGREAYVLFQAMATGHATYSTVHADSAQSLIHRLEGKPINIPRVMLQSLDVVSLHIITKVENKRARRCKQVIEIIDIDPTTKEILTNEVFRWDPVEDKFVYSGKSFVLERIRAEKDYSRDQITGEIKNRMKLVEYMNNTNIRGFRDVAHLVSKYIDNPKETLKQAESNKVK